MVLPCQAPKGVRVLGGLASLKRARDRLYVRTLSKSVCQACEGCLCVLGGLASLKSPWKPSPYEDSAKVCVSGTRREFVCLRWASKFEKRTETVSM